MKNISKQIYYYYNTENYVRFIGKTICIKIRKVYSILYYQHIKVNVEINNKNYK